MHVFLDMDRMQLMMWDETSGCGGDYQKGRMICDRNQVDTIVVRITRRAAVS